MDSNNVPYFLLREPEEFAQKCCHLQWDKRRQCLMLAQNQELRLPQASINDSLTAWAAAKSLVFDHFGQLARVHTSGHYVEYNAGRGYLPLADGELKPVDVPNVFDSLAYHDITGSLNELALGADGRLAVGYSVSALDASDVPAQKYGLLVFHLAKRWQAAVELPELPLRLWVAPDKSIWCLSANLLIQCRGEPLPHTYIPRIIVLSRWSSIRIR